MPDPEADREPERERGRAAQHPRRTERQTSEAEAALRSVRAGGFGLFGACGWSASSELESSSTHIGAGWLIYALPSMKAHLARGGGSRRALDVAIILAHLREL
jgi:hypothetical protein